MSKAQSEEKEPTTADKAQSPEEPKAETLEQVQAERDRYLDMLKRTKAEFENYQKRMQKERLQERQYMYGPLLFDLLPVLDNLERAIDAASKAGETGPLVDGVAMVQSQFVDLLKRYNVERINADGETFDPNKHQAMMQQPSKEHEPDTVIQVIEHGYMNHDRVLRPAKVIVSAASKE